MGKIKLCALCKNSREMSTLFSIPKNPEISKQWIEIITSYRRSNKISPEKGIICRNHFSDDSFQCPTSKGRLLPNAVPTLLLIPHNNEGDANDDDEDEGGMESDTDSDEVDISNMVDVELNENSQKNCNEDVPTSNNWSELCRICLQNKNNCSAVDGSADMANIYEVTINSLDISLPELFSSFTALQLEQIDGFPTKICTSCQNGLVTSYEFQLKCIKSDHDIRMAFGYSPQKSTIEVKFEQNCIFVNEDNLPVLLDGKIKDEIGDFPDMTEEDPTAGYTTSYGEIKPKLSTDDETSSESEYKAPVKKKKKKKVYRCLICNKNCDKSSNLRRHQKVHDPEGKPYECKYCKRRFAEEKRMTTHVLTHLKDKTEPIENSVDQSKYSDDSDSDYDPEGADDKKEIVNVKTEKSNDDAEKVSFKIAYVTDSSESEYHTPRRKKRTKYSKEISLTCDICNKSFSKRSRLIRHLQIHNPEGKPFECKICKRRFPVELHMIRHELSHEDEDKPKIYQCKVCQREFINAQGLSSHMNVHKDVEKTQIFSCKFCDKTFPTLKQCSRHSRSHDESKIHRCHICDKGYAARGELVEHIRFKHEGIVPYVCTICNKGFQNLYAHTVHVRSHSGETTFLCSECGKGFADKSGLRNHMIYHNKIKPHQCPECPSQFHTNSELKKHMVTHSGIRAFKCEYCGAGFAAKTTLKVHTRTHTGERPYKCSVCERGFISAGVLICHMRTHTGERPYKCEFCGRQFAERGVMNKHRHRLHINTGEKPFKCEHCSCEFSDKGVLNRHTRQLHLQGKVFNCEKCSVEFRLMTELRKHNKEFHYVPKPKVKRIRKKKLKEPKLEPTVTNAAEVSVDSTTATMTIDLKPDILNI